MCGRSKKVRDMATTRKLKLSDSVMHHKFKRDAADVRKTTDFSNTISIIYFLSHCYTFVFLVL